jgi:hypothetical protein
MPSSTARNTGVPPKKKMSPVRPYLSEDFNYLYTILNDCE